MHTLNLPGWKVIVTPGTDGVTVGVLRTEPSPEPAPSAVPPRPMAALDVTTARALRRLVLEALHRAGAGHSVPEAELAAGATALCPSVVTAATVHDCLAYLADRGWAAQLALGPTGGPCWRITADGVDQVERGKWW